MARIAAARGPLVVLMAALVFAAVPAAGYYHYVHFAGRTAPFTPMQEKFDLTALPNKTVTFFVTISDSILYTGTDSFNSVLGQLRQAAAAWDGVATSDLRVAFGGIGVSGSGNTPDAEIVFQDMPPGLLGLTSPTAGTTPAAGPTGQFMPIRRSVMALSRDLTKRPGPSFMEVFYTTAVHEMGHALGLQHTFTGAAMTVYAYRNTSRLHALDADDVAGISVLYPRNFAGNFGTITGHVLSNGQPVNMAYVTALRPSGSAVSAMTSPDGSYRIDGLPSDSYFVYVQPAPPTADIKPPVDLTGQPFSPNPQYFETLFYPGTRDPAQFTALSVGRGATISGIDFSVQPRTSLPLYDVEVWNYLGATAISPAYLNASQSGVGTVVSAANFTTLPRAVYVLGGFGPVGMRPYGNPVNLALDLNFPLFAGTGQRHLLFAFANDMFVLPAGLNLVQKNPPQIVAVLPQGDGSVIVQGANMSADSRVFFDGIPATVRIPFLGSDAQGQVMVVPPPGASGQRATITVYNSDGQNSMFLQSQNPPAYSYGVTDTPQVSVSPAALPAGGTPAGTSALIDIIGINTNFVDGLVSVGFGTPDVSVRRVWVLSPAHAAADVVVAPTAAPGSTLVNVISGSQTITQNLGFQIQPAISRLPGLTLPVANAVATISSLFPGAIASIYGYNLAANQSGVSVTVNDQPVTLQSVSPSQINFTIPASTPLGMAIVKLNNGTDAAFPIGIQIDPPPPVVTAVTTVLSAPIDPGHPAQGGDTVNVFVSGMDPSVALNPSRVRINVGGVDLMPLQVIVAPGQPNLMMIPVVLPPGSSGIVTLSVSLDGSSSMPFLIAMR